MKSNYMNMKSKQKVNNFFILHYVPPTMPPPILLLKEDILSFFQASTRDGNDEANKRRERVLKHISNLPVEFTEDAVHGASWIKVKKEWEIALEKVAQITDIPSYTKVVTTSKGGRTFNYDILARYDQNDSMVGVRKIEFKYGGDSIGQLPQFLSLQAKFPLFELTYDSFYYSNYLAKYLECDEGITEPIPSLVVYLTSVVKVKSAGPFFTQLKDREEVNKEAKAAVVNTSITDYLTQYAGTIKLGLFEEKLKESQLEKVYLLWSNGVFHLDKFRQEEMISLSYTGIKNGNVIICKAGNTRYELLLRWRNHKGILNPAWQISVKRE
jgi:hypothetical protein